MSKAACGSLGIIIKVKGTMLYLSDILRIVELAALPDPWASGAKTSGLVLRINLI